jgi:starvation-inducible DNA-binding protein
MKTNKTFATRNNIPLETRTVLISLLNQQLADTFDLHSQTKQAHWNVKGPQFHQLHLLFDSLATDLAGHVDLIAERITTLGGVALGTARMTAAHTRLPELPADGIQGMACVHMLAERYAQVVAASREGIDTAADQDDQATADLFTEITRSLDQALWFLEAHIQE